MILTLLTMPHLMLGDTNSEVGLWFANPDASSQTRVIDLHHPPPPNIPLLLFFSCICWDKETFFFFFGLFNDLSSHPESSRLVTFTSTSQPILDGEIGIHLLESDFGWSW